MAGHRDPTANAAIGRVMREQRSSSPGLLDRFPDFFADLTQQEARKVVMRALDLTGWRMTNLFVNGNLLKVGH